MICKDCDHIRYLTEGEDHEDLCTNVGFLRKLFGMYRVIKCTNTACASFIKKQDEDVQ